MAMLSTGIGSGATNFATSRSVMSTGKITVGINTPER
jgi:hypothetical protein